MTLQLHEKLRLPPELELYPNYSLAELFFGWISWLDYSLSELCLDWAIPWVNYALSELFLGWTIPWLNHSLSEPLIYGMNDLSTYFILDLFHERSISFLCIYIYFWLIYFIYFKTSYLWILFQTSFNDGASYLCWIFLVSKTLKVTPTIFIPLCRVKNSLSVLSWYIESCKALFLWTLTSVLLSVVCFCLWDWRLCLLFFQEDAVWILSFVRHSRVFVSICPSISTLFGIDRSVSSPILSLGGCLSPFGIISSSCLLNGQFSLRPIIVLYFVLNIDKFSFSSSCKDLLLEIRRLGWNPTCEIKGWQITLVEKKDILSYIISRIWLGHTKWKDIHKNGWGYNTCYVGSSCERLK